MSYTRVKKVKRLIDAIKPIIENSEVTPFETFLALSMVLKRFTAENLERLRKDADVKKISLKEVVECLRVDILRLLERERKALGREEIPDFREILELTNKVQNLILDGNHSLPTVISALVGLLQGACLAYIIHFPEEKAQIYSLLDSLSDDLKRHLEESVREDRGVV